MPPYGVRFSPGLRATIGRPYDGYPPYVRTNPVGGWRTTPQAHDAPQVSLQCSHKLKKAPPVKGAGAAYGV